MAQHIPIQSIEGKRYREIEKSIYNNPPSRGSLKWQFIDTYLDNDIGEYVERYEKVIPVKVNKTDFGITEISLEVNIRKNKINNSPDKNITGIYLVA